MAQAALTTPLVGPLSYRDLCAQTVDVASTIRWCQSLKLLRSNLMCSCGRGMNLVEAGKEGVLWRCPRKGCRREVSLRKDTFFVQTHDVERMTGECFLVEVQQRDAATLLPIVQNFVMPGSIVYSDE